MAKVVFTNYCRKCQKRTTQGLITKGRKFLVSQCIMCRTVSTYSKVEIK